MKTNQLKKRQKMYKPIAIKLLFFFLASSLLFSCSKLNEVSVSSQNFQDEIAITQNLVFSFNKDLVGEKDLENWDYTPYIEIEPKVDGAFKWSSKNELVFSPSTGFRPATAYKAKLSKALIGNSKELSVSSETIEFHTPALKAENIQTYWSRSADGKQTLKGKLAFNYPVETQTLGNIVQVSLNDKSSPAIVANSNNSEVATITIPNAPQNKEETPIKITVDGGVKIANVGSTSKEKFELDASIPSPFELQVVDVQSGFDNKQGFIKVITTQEIAKDKIAENYTIEPKVETSAEPIENGFIIKGNFSPDETYILTIKQNLRGTLGAKLAADFTQDVFLGELPATVEFTSKKGLYLSSKGNKNIGIRIANVEQVNMKVYKIYENNIIAYLKNSRYKNYDYSEESEEGADSGPSPSSYTYENDYNGIYSDLLLERKIEAKSLPKTRGVSLLNMSLPTPNKLKGVYLVSINSNNDYYLNANKLVSISDIGLIAKQSADGDEIYVFANSILTAEALANVEVSLVSSNNQSVYTEKTDSKGVAVFKKIKEKAPNFKIALIAAHTEDDFNFMLMEDTQIETSRFEVDGKRANAAGYEAFVYGDRDIYRPGETLHFNTVVRDTKWQSASDIPLKIRVLIPNGKELKSILKNTNEQGAIETSLQLDRAAVTGTYTIEVLNGNDVLLTSKNISIEEFMPDRIKVDVAGKDAYQAGETVDIVGTATNLFGPPASGRNYEMDFSLKRKVFTAKGFESYSFDIPNDTKFNNDLRQGVTDENGLAKQAFPLPVAYKDMGVLEGKAYITVFDETGRPVNRVKRFDVFTQSTFYGIGVSDYYVGTHAPMSIAIVALNQQGKLKESNGVVEIYRIDYQTVVEKTDGQLKYQSKKKEILVQTKDVRFAGGKSVLKFVPNVSGEYEVRVRANKESIGYSLQQFYAYGYGSTSSSSFEVSNEGKVLIEFDKEKYQVGEDAKVLFKTPFAGKLLVTVEKDKVLQHFFVDTDKKSAEISFEVSDAMLPNVYITATLIRPMQDSNIPLTVAHGFAPMKVEKASNILPIEIKAPEESRSKRKQHISIQTKPNTELTIAVVDEGILQLKNFKTPDIYEYFYQKRALEVTGYDLYALLFPELSLSNMSSFGGDGYNLEKRVNPLSNGRNKLVAIWSGTLKADGSGNVNFDFEIPQFSGDLRIMAVAYKNEAFGSASKNMKVKDPIVISTGAPRFLSPNDEVNIPVTITNTTKTDATVSASAALSGGLALLGTNNQSITIPAGKEARTTFTVKAPASIGNGKISITVNGFKEKFSENIELTVRPVTSLLKTSNSGMILAGQNQSIDLRNDYMAGTAKANVLLSRSPMVQFAKELDYLLGYPHGCVEQTVAKAFPQLYFADFTKTIAKKSRAITPLTYGGGAGGGATENDWNPQFNVQAAIKKIENMQLYNGGLAYWQGGDTESWWGTAFAAHFLQEAQKAGYEINEASLNKMYDYLTGKTASQLTTENEYVYDETGTTSTRVIARREMIYTLYTLALAGKPNHAVMNYYKSNQNLLSTDARYMLAATYKQIGDDKSFAQLLPKDYAVQNTKKELSGSFSSPLRNLAISLNSLIEADPQNLQIPKMARQLSLAVKASPYLNTQESTFSFLALGKLAKKAAQSSVTASLLADNKLIANFTGADLNLEKGIDGKLLNVSTKGKGGLYYFSQQEGLSATGKYVEEDQFLKVRRQFYTRSGQLISGNQFKANQLVVVKVSISSINGVPIDNVVVTDMLPAAFEIENPRLNEARDMTWIKNASTPQYFDIRDDRINYYTTAGSTEQSYYYLVRVVSKGKFALGPISADAMYNGEYRSYSGGGVVSVD